MSLSLEKQIYCFNDRRKRDLGSTRIRSLFSLLVSIKEQQVDESGRRHLFFFCNGSKCSPNKLDYVTTIKGSLTSQGKAHYGITKHTTKNLKKQMLTCRLLPTLFSLTWLHEVRENPPLYIQIDNKLEDGTTQNGNRSQLSKIILRKVESNKTKETMKRNEKNFTNLDKLYINI